MNALWLILLLAVFLAEQLHVVDANLDAGLCLPILVLPLTRRKFARNTDKLALEQIRRNALAALAE